MKMMCLSLLAVMAAVTFSSCSGECACTSYNKDYLRDVPVTTTRAFR